MRTPIITLLLLGTARGWFSVTHCLVPATPFNCGVDSVAFDGYLYPTVQIDTQCFFAENLRTSKYADGTSIPLITANSGWLNAINTETGARCNHSNSSSNLNLYVHLYNWFAVDDPAGLCPSGWHEHNRVFWVTPSPALVSP